MANETNTPVNKALKVLAAGQEVERAAVAADGTVTIRHGQAQLLSVDVADVDLLLSFSDGSFTIIPNGALDALGTSPRSVIFNDGRGSLGDLFKLVGIINPAKAGSLRLVSENIDAAPPPAEESVPVSEPPVVDSPPAPMVKVGVGTSAGPGKGPGNGAGTGEGEVPATVTPLQPAAPPVYRVGHSTQTIQDLLNATGLGQPNVTAELYTSSAFKLAPSGRTDLPAGAYDATATPDQLATNASPAHQATREVIQGTAGADTIDFNSAFSSDVGQWSKTLHITLNNFSDVTSIQIVVSADVLNPLSTKFISGFDLQGTGVTRDGTTNSWHVTPDAAMLLNGLDVSIVYNVKADGTPVTTVDFITDLYVDGHAGLFAFQVIDNLNLTWRDAETTADFTVTSSTGAPLMVLPNGGVGVEVWAGNGDDVVNAGAGRDVVHGEAGNDQLYGGRGNDVLDGGLGGDILDGEQGNDTASYALATALITARLDTNGVGNTGEAAADTYVSIENLAGSIYADILIGDGNENILSGGDGNDKLVGKGGYDTLNGGTGTDTASYEFAPAAVTVSLTTNTGTQGEALGDVLNSIENLIGSAYNDTFTGAAGDQANAFDGGAGTGDTVSYAPSSAGVFASLTASLVGVVHDDAYGDTFPNIENLTGSAYADTLIGDIGINALIGGRGDDLLEGLGGADAFQGGLAADTANLDTDTVTYAHSTLGVVSSLTVIAGVVQINDAFGDTYVSIENLTGSGLDDTLIGNTNNNILTGSLGNDILEGMSGADVLDGGASTTGDTASYAHAASAVSASLTTGGVMTGFAAGGDATGDTYISIENLTGSDYNDTLVGTSFIAGLDTGINILSGGLGNDTLEGLGGADALNGDGGNNTASYEHSTDQGAGVGVVASLANSAANSGDAAGDVYSNIQNLLGSAYNDTLTGDGYDNVLTGAAGDDTMTGGAGADTLYAGDGNDVLSDDGSSAAALYGGTGNDSLTLTSADATVDFIDGGTGTDTLVWAYNVSSYVYVDMVAGSVNYSSNAPASGVKTNFTSIENFTAAGNNYAYVYASNVDNVIIGGSTASDYVDYRNAVAGVYVNLLTGVATGGSGNDTLSGIENIYAGSYYNDTLIGDGNNNWIRGSYGADTLNGGGGRDTWYLDWSGISTTASLLTAAQNAAMGIVMTGDAAGDTVSNFESIYASYGDSIYGDAVSNDLYGRGLIEGFKGNDYINGAGSSATASYANAGNSYLFTQGITSGNGVGVTATLTTGLGVFGSGDAAGDTYSGSIANIMGSAYADTLIGNSSINLLTGGAGDDILEGLGAGDIFQGGTGSDTVSYAHSVSGVLVDLSGIRTQTNDAAGDVFTSIENVIGSNGNDFIYGDNGDNILVGGLGNDTLDGSGGYDTVSYASATGSISIDLSTNTVTGAAGNDTLISIENIIGSTFVDTIYGTAGDDVIDGGALADTINGGVGGSDTVSYASATGFKNVNLTTGVNTDGDTLISIENIIGTSNNETLVGNADDNIIEGGLGDDALDGAANAAGGDTTSYAHAAAGVTVSLAIVGVAQNTGAAGSDTLTNFENLLGSAYNDTLTGDGGANVLTGGAGDDILIGGAGGDTLIGGTGTNTVSYATAASGVTVTINGLGSLGDANGDVLSGIQNLIGSSGDDSLTGDGSANVFDGLAGINIINGGAGIDTVSYASASGAMIVDIHNGGTNATGGALGSTRSDQLSLIENITGSAFADHLTGDGGANTIEGGAGADILIGFGGGDTASYAGSSAAVTVNLATGAGTGGDAAGDVLSNFVNLIGSAGDDTLIGDGNANILDGGAGNDTLIGGALNDTLIGGSGNNTVSYAGAIGVGVTASLATGTGTAGDASGDSFSGIQNLTGSDYADNLYGDGAANILFGGSGNDRMDGNDGNDTINITTGRDTTYGGNGDDLFIVNAVASDTLAGANLPTLVSGDGNTSWAASGGDTIKLTNLGGTYSLTALATVTNGMEYLDIRDGVNTVLNLTSLDVRNYADGGSASQIWVLANSGDSINIGGMVAANETLQQTTGVSGTTDYTIFNSVGTQVAQIHWQAA